MRKTVICLSLLALVALGGQAVAEIGTIDAVPAATLLLPYFEVDLADPEGITTLFSINNASAAAAIAHVTLWTDLSIPTLDFNVFLTGYDVHTINLRDLFVGTGAAGVFPVSRADNAATGAGGSSVAGRRGPWSWSTPQTQLAKPGFNPTSAFGNCFDQLPLPNLPDPWFTHIRNAHRGLGSTFFGGQCSAVNHGDSIARGYITIDNVNYCTLDFPEDESYWVGATRAPSNVNQLWGDYFYVELGQNFAQGMNLVHIEAREDLAPPDYTFYNRYSALHGTTDNREGLGSTFAARYITEGILGGNTSFQVWRDAKRGGGRSATTGIPTFSCAANPPSPFPLGQTQVVVFDEEENPDQVIVDCPVSPCIDIPDITPFPWEAQRRTVGGSALPTPFDAGWVYMNLNSFVTGQTVAIYDPNVMQNWVTTVMTADGRFAVGYEAIQLDNVTFPFTSTNIELPVLPPAP